MRDGAFDFESVEEVAEAVVRDHKAQEDSERGEEGQEALFYPNARTNISFISRASQRKRISTASN